MTDMEAPRLSAWASHNVFLGCCRHVWVLWHPGCLSFLAVMLQSCRLLDLSMDGLNLKRVSLLQDAWPPCG